MNVLQFALVLFDNIYMSSKNRTHPRHIFSVHLLFTWMNSTSDTRYATVNFSYC
jgi:predicted RNA-binding protein with PIN domain